MIPMTGADRLRSLAPANETLLRRLPFTTVESASVGQTSAQLRAPASTLASSRSEGTRRSRKHHLATQASSPKYQFRVALIPNQPQSLR